MEVIIAAGRFVGERKMKIVDFISQVEGYTQLERMIFRVLSALSHNTGDLWSSG